MSASFQLSCLHWLWRLVPPENSCRVHACALWADPGGAEPAMPMRSRAGGKIARANLAARSRAAAGKRLGGALRTVARRAFGLPL